VPTFPSPAPGLILTAPSSNSGKTTVTLALIRALTRQGLRVATAKTGPDYIDPAFHAAAGGRACVNLDTWAMPPALLDGLAARLSTNADLVLCEGVMGLLDGATVPGDPTHDADADGSTAALAAHLGWPVVLVVDAKGMAASAGALVRGFRDARPGVTLAGVIFTRVGGPRHVETLRAGLTALAPDVPMLGALPRDERLALPSRHLGLVQAGEHPDLMAFLNGAADLATRHVNLDALAALAHPAHRTGVPESPTPVPVPPPGQRVAVASDVAFAFAYPATLAGWRAAGAELRTFSPLADEAPADDADAIYLPGGYPELHAGRLAANDRFREGLRAAAGRGVAVFGECGGYMVLGRGLVDAEGTRHAMAALLPVETSFAERRLHLGYRAITALGSTPFGPEGTPFRGHEFHYARVLTEEGAPLFTAHDARGRDLGPVGLRAGSVCGSFVHLIAASSPMPAPSNPAITPP